MFYACFQLLEDFVKKEKGHFYQNVYELYLDSGKKEAKRREKDWTKLRALHSWWMKRKEKKTNICQGYAEDTKKLVQLIKLRHLLWT